MKDFAKGVSSRPGWDPQPNREALRAPDFPRKYRESCIQELFCYQRGCGLARGSLFRITQHAENHGPGAEREALLAGVDAELEVEVMLRALRRLLPTLTAGPPAAAGARPAAVVG